MGVGVAFYGVWIWRQRCKLQIGRSRWFGDPAHRRCRVAQQRWLVPAVCSLHGPNNMWMGPPQEAITSREYMHPDMNRQLCRASKDETSLCVATQTRSAPCITHGEQPWGGAAAWESTAPRCNDATKRRVLLSFTVFALLLHFNFETLQIILLHHS